MAGIPEIPGGATERARLSGGGELTQQLGALLAGHRADAVLYALTVQVAGALLLLGDSLPEAKRLADVVAGDVKNTLEVNWHQHNAQVAASEALSAIKGVRQ